MKKPKWTGPKKNHSAIWIGESREFDVEQDYLERFRILTSNGKWFWHSADNSGRILNNDRVFYSEPCWLIEEENLEFNLKNMRMFDDIRLGNKTIFIGYVRDTE